MKYYHVTVLSNFAKGYDRYRRVYSKADIGESRFPDRFFVLKEDELRTGFNKASRLLDKIDIEGDRLIVIETEIDEGLLLADHASGLGQYVCSNEIKLTGIGWLMASGDGLTIEKTLVEEVMASSLGILNKDLTAWQDCSPRSISVLPVGLACQASCQFCFSKASVSSDFRGSISDWGRIEEALLAAKMRGAMRAVITGGGEPSLIKEEALGRLVGLCRESFDKVVLITNGERLCGPKSIDLRGLAEKGLGVLAVSRHHYNKKTAAWIMGLDVDIEAIAERVEMLTCDSLKMRLICVLQKNGVASAGDVRAYLDWASRLGISEVNFKELYVSTGLESAYADIEANHYSMTHQVPLDIIYEFVSQDKWRLVDTLPWGAPVFEGLMNGLLMRIAAYTEPSVLWERTSGIVRSWNLMSDGRLLASLEDINSEVA